MSREAMQKAISDFGASNPILSQARPYLLEVGDQIDDDILAIFPASHYSLQRMSRSHVFAES